MPRTRTIRYALRAIALLALLPLAAAAEEPVPVRSGILWLDWAADQVDFALREAVPGDPLAATHSIESIEIYRLQQEIHQLRLLIENEFIDRIIALEAELRAVRGALASGQPVPPPTGPIIPRPDFAPTGLPAATPLPAPTAPEMTLPDPTAPESLPPPAEFAFIAVDEWGRDPELVAELGGDAQTLIGVAGFVPPGSRREDVVGLIQELRAQYDAYDNINIEIFDTAAAARDYAERQSVDPGHHIASISRHKTSGRDVLLYLGGGKPEPVPLTAE